MKSSFILGVGLMVSLTLLGTGCIRRSSPARLENGVASPSSQAPGGSYRDAEGNLILPPGGSGKMGTDPSRTLPGIRPLDIGPDGKGPTSTTSTR